MNTYEGAALPTSPISLLLGWLRPTLGARTPTAPIPREITKAKRQDCPDLGEVLQGIGTGPKKANQRESANP